MFPKDGYVALGSSNHAHVAQVSIFIMGLAPISYVMSEKGGGNIAIDSY